MTRMSATAKGIGPRAAAMARIDPGIISREQGLAGRDDDRPGMPPGQVGHGLGARRAAVASPVRPSAASAQTRKHGPSIGATPGMLLISPIARS